MQVDRGVEGEKIGGERGGGERTRGAEGGVRMQPAGE